MKKVIPEIYAAYSPAERELLGKYISPSAEESYFKGIPMSLYKEVTRLLPIKGRRILFRGRSTSEYRRPRAWCSKAGAKTFAIYYKYPFLLSLGRPGAGMVTGGGPVYFGST
jgi:hypothetical protein